MSVVVAYHQEGDVETLVGCDGQSTSEGYRTSDSMEKWFFSSNHPWGIGAVGDIRTAMLVRRHGPDVLDEVISDYLEENGKSALEREDHFEIAFRVCDTFRLMLIEDDYIFDKSEPGAISFFNNLLIASPFSVFRADATMSPMEDSGFGGFYAIGSGMTEAISAAMILHRYGPSPMNAAGMTDVIRATSSVVNSVGGEVFLWRLTEDGVEEA